MAKREERDRLLVEVGEKVGHWHDGERTLGGVKICSKCPEGVLKTELDNPNFDEGKNLIRLLKIVRTKFSEGVNIPFWADGQVGLKGSSVIRWTGRSKDLDGVPKAIADEMAKVFEGERR
jgi:hypothetical protein